MPEDSLLPEEVARKKIDKQLEDAGWDIVTRDEYIPGRASAVTEALMKGNKESDYLLFIDGKATAIIEAKREGNELGENVAKQAENYARTPENWYGLWPNSPKTIPLVYLANGKKILFKNLLTDPDGDYAELNAIHSPKKMLKLIGEASMYGALPRLDVRELRNCQYEAEINFEQSLRDGKRKGLAILATGSGKTYLACLASYRLLNYTPTKRILFLVDRNNLARQTEAEFSKFDCTENRQEMSSLYEIKRLKRNDDIKADIVISTIQKLYAVLTGRKLDEDDEDYEDEKNTAQEDIKTDRVVELGDNLKLPPDYFQLIIVDECHRSIYGKWKSVLDYFSGASILGLTATPTPEAYVYFDNNIIEEYKVKDSEDDGVNVPPRIYRIDTKITSGGGNIKEGSTVTETSKKTGELTKYVASQDIGYTPSDLDRTIVNLDQIKEVLRNYRDAIYSDLYPERPKQWEYIPKTLIFAKNDKHARSIVACVKDVFGEVFENGRVPDGFVRRITYSAGNSNDLIRDFRTEKNFRIAVTVTLVATGTDIKPLEVVMFMKDVFSDVLYTQMKGRGCRVISDDRLREVTPNADTKYYYYIVDAVGVTEHEKNIPSVTNVGQTKSGYLSLGHLIEHLAHGELNDDNLCSLRDYCAGINSRYENNALIRRHLDTFIDEFGYAPNEISATIQDAIDDGELDANPYISPSGDNLVRKGLVRELLDNIRARNALLELQKGYSISVTDDPDTTIYRGFSYDDSKEIVDNFEQYIKENRDNVKALQIIYNSSGSITYSMLIDLRDKLLARDGRFKVTNLWRSYKVLDTDGRVDDLSVAKTVNTLTDLIQIVRFAYGKNRRLTSLVNGYTQRFNLYCGQHQRDLTDEQSVIMRQIAEYIIHDGEITQKELNVTDTDLWRKAIINFSPARLAEEMHKLAGFLLRTA